MFERNSQTLNLIFYILPDINQYSFQFQVMYDSMENRLPKVGALVKAYSFEHILHPVYRGLILSDFNLTTKTLELFIADNETA